MGAPSDTETRTEHDDVGFARADADTTPGVVLVFAAGSPRLVPHSLAPGEVSYVGRKDFGGAVADDERVSRRHVAIRVTEDGFVISDAGSRNGTFVNGTRVEDSVEAKAGALVRFGRSLALLTRNVRVFHPPRPLEEGDAIVGPTLRAAWDQIRSAARAGENVHLLGESGSGKELAARVYHDATNRGGMLVAINCATIPSGVAERLLFGAKRGAYSGADKDADGYLQSANGGTLFLDEIAELDLDVQAKLLRAIESSEILPLGASRPLTVDVRLCTATHTDLRAAVGRRAFREDLYFRIGRPEVRLPALRDRKEEIPWLVARELGALHARYDLLETCLLRPWPGNVRELRSEMRRAAVVAASAGRDEVWADDLDRVAGTEFEREGDPPSELVAQRRVPSAESSDARIRQALADTDGNVTEAARRLGMHRTQLRRWITKGSYDVPAGPGGVASATEGAPSSRPSRGSPRKP